MATESRRALIDLDGLQRLIATLAGEGYRVIGPQLADGAIVYRPLAPGERLPAGWVDRQAGGEYRLQRGERPALFDYALGPHSWKQYLFPARQRLWRAERAAGDDGDFRVRAEPQAVERYAFIGVRGCELQALRVQDRVFAGGPHGDPSYRARRAAAFIVAVHCARPADTCFCVSTGSGPRAEGAYDLALSELLDGRRHEFLIESGSARGAELLTRLPRRAADPDSVAAAAELSATAARVMRRALPADAESLLKRNPEHPRWDRVAERCLSCGNCTLVCPTCFCTEVTDSTDLAGEVAERWRQWDSCFTLAFSSIHGGSIRASGRSRYRQWLSHKLAYWHDQFGSCGCVGCGRCISWCPVGIDLTEEVAAIAASDGERGT